MIILSSNPNLEVYLSNKQKALEEQIKFMEKGDPLMLDLPSEASESGTDSWQADVHARTVVLKNSLLQLSTKVKKAILKLKAGTYGICDRCGKRIDSQRLEAIPVADLCTICVSYPSHR